MAEITVDIELLIETDRVSEEEGVGEDVLPPPSYDPVESVLDPVDVSIAVV